MDKRRIKKGPSLLGKNVSDNDFSNNNSKDLIAGRKPREVLSKTRPRSALENSDSSGEEGLLVLSNRKGKLTSSTQLSSAEKMTNITSRRRLVNPSPERQIISDDSEENETFITKPKKTGKSQEYSKKKDAVKTPEKRRRLLSDSSESDAPKATPSKSGTTGKNSSGRKSNAAKNSPAKLSGLDKNSQSKMSRLSSVTHYSSQEIHSTDEEDEGGAENDVFQSSSTRRASGTRTLSSKRTSVTPKKRKLGSGGGFSKEVVEETGSTDDDMFLEVSPAKSSKKSRGNSPAKWQSTRNISPKKNKDKSIVVQQKSTVSPQTSSRMTRSQSAKKSPIGKNSALNFEQFLKRAGILLADDGPNLLCENWRPTVEKLNVLISSKEYDKEQIIKQFEYYIDDVNNLQSILGQTMVNEQESLINENTESVARILLNVPSLQTGIATALLNRLAMAILIEDSLDSVPWSGTLLRQFKFLEQITDPVILVEKLGELLESARKCFQSEMISYLPDIVIDAQHHAVGELLSKLIDDNSELTAVILDCISRLTLSKDYLEAIRDKALDLLKGNPLQSSLPAITRFILGECSTPESRVRALTALRSVDMQPLADVNLEECYTNQVLTVSALKTSNQVSKQVADAAFTVIQRVKKDPKPLDLVMLLLIFSSNSTKKKNVEVLLKNRIRSGFYRPSLLHTFYYDFREVARDLQSTAIPLASHLLKAGDRVYAEFAIEWFRLLFLSQESAIHKQQEVLAKIIKLTGAGTETSKNALAILSRIARKEEEREYLQKHSHHLRTLLEEVDELDLEEVATVSDLLHGLCVSSNSTSDALQADLDIVLIKQLAAVQTVTKCKGVLGALMAIKHSASYPRTKERALHLFEEVVKAVKSCPRSRALFYDQMADVIGNTKNLDDCFLETFKEHFTAELTTLYLTDTEGYRGSLSPQFSLNSEVESPPDQEYGVHFGEGNDGSAVSALFKVIKACCLREGRADLSEIDALLACPVFMSKDLNDPDASVLDQIFHCINWFREIISGFVTQIDSGMEKVLLKRLDHLMTLQGELSMNLTMAEPHYQPPVCYFHHFPSPPFVKIEKKTVKRANKTILDKSQSLSEWSSWEAGSVLVCKNPAYFRRLDAKIAHLLDFSMEVRLTGSRTNCITTAQVSFIIKELLGMLENEASQSFMKDLVGLLPKVCAKLDQVTTELRNKDDSQNRECLRLLLCLLAAIFNWKGFHNFVNNPMLREALRVVASQTDETNTLLRSCKELVTQSCSFVESLADVATRISVAIALVNLFQALIQHSESLAQQHKGSLAKMAFGFLCLDWPDDKSNGASYRTAVATLLNSWLTNEPDPLDTVVTLLKWLPKEAEKLSRPQDSLARILSINKNTFNILFKQIFLALVQGVKISLVTVKRDSERIEIWNSVTTGVQGIIEICKTMELKPNWLLFLKYIPTLLKLFITCGMPVLEHNLKYHVDEVTGIVKKLQDGTRYLHVLCCHTTVTGDTSLAKFVPVAKSTLERLVFSVKGMLVLNNSPQAFWMGNLINKDIKGQAIEMEQSTEESTTVSVNSVQTDVSEELLTDDSDESMDNDNE